MQNTLIIGVSARIYYPAGPVLDLGGVWTRTLHYLEQSVAHWIMSGDAMPVMVPAVDRESLTRRSEIDLVTYAAKLDGLVLQGGNDVAPESYDERPLRPEWEGDRIRDRYEMELVQAFIDAGKPVFGICRGLQLLNVKFGGTLYQDIATERPTARQHVDRARYEELHHEVELVQGSRLARSIQGGGGPASTASTTRESRISRRASTSRRVARRTGSSRQSGAPARPMSPACNGTRSSIRQGANCFSTTWRCCRTFLPRHDPRAADDAFGDP